MDKRNKTALAYLLVGVAAAGRALLAVPENAAIQEVSRGGCRRSGWGREVCGSPKYFGQWHSSLPPALRGHLPRRGRQGRRAAYIRI